MLPPMPVTIITAVVTPAMPPNSSLRDTPMAVVTDLGSRDTISSWSNSSSRPSTRMVPMQATEPAITPARIAFRFLRSTRNCSYMGIARQMVAGVISQDSRTIPAV